MSESELRQKVAEACWILFNEGQEHFYLGHISAREPGSDRVYVKPTGIGLGEVRPEDLAVIDLDGKQLEGSRPIHQEMPIHTGIYRARPDVCCVVHTHPFYVAAFAAASADFQMVTQDSVLFVAGFGFYQDPQLVVTKQQGEELARCLGDRNAVVLKNHGLATASATVEEAVFLAASFDRSLRVQMAAAQLGPLSPMSNDQARQMAEYFESSYPAGRIQSSYRYLLRSARRAGLGAGQPSDG